MEWDSKFQIGYKGGVVVLNHYGSPEVPPCHFTWTPAQAREIARQLSLSADAVDREHAAGQGS
jgi:hypothetical protein